MEVVRNRRVARKVLSVARSVALLASLSVGLLLAQVSAGTGQSRSTSTASVNAAQDNPGPISSSHAEDELQKGTALTRHGDFRAAIPHLLAARGRVTNEYAATFNLALCYVGTREYEQAIQILNDFELQGKKGADVENLLAQAYVGNGQPKEALATLERAAALTPQNENLYLFVAEACTDNQDNVLALKVVEVGLKNIPESPRLRYERGMVLSQLDELDRAKRDFDFVSKTAAGTEIGYVSKAEEDLFEGNVSEAAVTAREGIQKGFKIPILQTLLGDALLRSGATPGQPEFEEAQSALEEAAAERPSDPSSQIALGRLYLAAGRSAEAIVHLEKAKQMQPDRPVIYASLAKAYQRSGNEPAAQQALATLEKLNLARAEQIRSAPGERRMSYGGTALETTPPKQ